MLATPMCRRCMRVSHRANPFHRIEQWNGMFFCLAKLSEVGTYLLVRHHVGQPICDTLTHWCNMLETAEGVKDLAEQDFQPEPVPVPNPDPYMHGDFDGEGQGDRVWENVEGDDEDDGGEEEELEDLNQYLASRSEVVGAGAGALPGSAIPGSYVRVVHSNGLHHIPMVSCHCQGQDTFPLDLFAAQLLPASFKRTKTLFTAQALDMFHCAIWS